MALQWFYIKLRFHTKMTCILIKIFIVDLLSQEARLKSFIRYFSETVFSFLLYRIKQYIYEILRSDGNRNTKLIYIL